jgi:hypothetical protein
MNSVQFTGSYSYSGFRSCIAINPWDAKTTAEAILQVSSFIIVARDFFDLLYWDVGAYYERRGSSFKMDGNDRSAWR